MLHFMMLESLPRTDTAAYWIHSYNNATAFIIMTHVIFYVEKCGHVYYNNVATLCNKQVCFNHTLIFAGKASRVTFRLVSNWEGSGFGVEN